MLSQSLVFSDHTGSHRASGVTFFYSAAATVNCCRTHISFSIADHPDSVIVKFTFAVSTVPLGTAKSYGKNV